MNGWPMAPDDPRWLTIPPKVECYDTEVFLQVGVPRAFLELAKRRCETRAPAGGRSVSVGADLSFLDELVEDPDARPYVWDLPDDCF